MKTLFKTIAATTALIAAAGTAQAQSVYTPGSGSSTASQGSPESTQTETFFITGDVEVDCSFYTGGATAAQRTINLGDIGIYNTSTQGLANAFRMTGPSSGSAATSVAGCNFANDVTITKKNGIAGLQRTGNQDIGFDSSQFRTNIPYEVAASFTAVVANNIKTGEAQVLSASTGSASATGFYGAWKSPLTLSVFVPVADRALVAGIYQDEVTIELKARL